MLVIVPKDTASRVDLTTVSPAAYMVHVASLAANLREVVLHKVTMPMCHFLTAPVAEGRVLRTTGAQWLAARDAAAASTGRAVNVRLHEMCTKRH